MRRYFNTEGQCEADIHYMVRLDERLDKIKRLFVDRGKYFVINRGRQYGKTTTLMALEEYLAGDYFVIFMDFQKLSSNNFETENKFVCAFAKYFINCANREKFGADGQTLQELAVAAADGHLDLNGMFVYFSQLCKEADKPVVLMIDEVDSASNHKVFLDFLALLRGYYLERKKEPAFYSVILAGVYDIKNLKLKIRPEKEHQYNSPWNIAARFNIDMSFSCQQIASMLTEYEEDNKTGMDVSAVSKCIYEYTSGYPYLVSAICKFLDEEIPGREGFESIEKVWTKTGIGEAVKFLLKESISLFESMVKQLDEFGDLRNMLEDIIYQGKQIPYSPDVKSISMGVMFGFLREEKGHIVVSNRIFEMRLLNMFIAEEAAGSRAFQHGQRDKNQFIENARLNMDLVLEKFVVYFTEIYGDNDRKFIEDYGRKIFLLYLKPIINGVGNYYLEAQTRDARRTDVVIDYLGEQFVVELKIWHGNEYNERGEEQLAGYLDFFHQKKGYMISYNFNKKKQAGIRTIQIKDKVLIEAVV